MNLYFTTLLTRCLTTSFKEGTLSWNPQVKGHGKEGSYWAAKLLLYVFVCLPAKMVNHEVTNSAENMKLLRIIKYGENF